MYAPQCGLHENTKDKFYNKLLVTVSKFDEKENVVVAGDLNGHVGKSNSGFKVCMGDMALGREMLRLNKY